MTTRQDNVSQSATFGQRQLAQVAVFALGYWLLRQYCFSLPAAAPNLSYVWLPDGLTLGVLLCTRVRHWPPYLIAIMAVGILDARRELGPTLLGNAFNVVEPAFVAYALSRVFGSPVRMEGVRAITILFFGPIPLMAGATLATSGVNWWLYSTNYWEVWRAWFVSDALGMLLVAPLMIAWSGSVRPLLRELRGARLFQGALAFAALITATHVAYAIPEPFGKGVTLAAISAPFLLLAGLRFGLRGATLALAIHAVMGFWYTSHGFGHFSRTYSDPYESVISLQIYLALMGVLLLLPAALLSERTRVMKESAGWRRRYESLLSASQVLMYEVAAGTRRFSWGGNVQEVLGIDPACLQDVPAWLERVHPEDRHLLAGLRERFASGEINSVSREYRLRRDDGAYITVGVTAYGIIEGQRTDMRDPAPVAPQDVRVVGFIRDISDKKRADEEKRALEDRLKQSEKMEAIGRFADGIAHDFNNILGAVLGYGELAKGKAPAGSDMRRYLETIQSAGERGRSLVAQILTFSRAKPADKRPVLLAELIEEVVVQVQGSLTPGVTIVSSNSCNGAVVLGEATQLHQLTMNLCTNAAQAMPAGGEVRLSVRPMHSDAERAALVGKLQAADYVEIEVQDSGLGMDEATTARMFEPFFTTKPVGQGTGLGLSLVQSIVLEHGGALEVESAPGRGTRIRAFLPEAGGGWERPSTAERSLPMGNGETVLVIDDEPALANLAQEILVELGYEALAYTSSVEALAVFEKNPGRFDAVLSDEVMPELTGTQVAARLRRTHAQLPILLITGYGGPGFEIRANEAGVNRVLRKPYRRRELAEALAALLATRA